MNSKRYLPAAVSVLVVSSLVACGASPTTSDRGRQGTTGEVKTTYPLSVKNCGATITFNAPPKRALVMGSPSMELVETIAGTDAVASTYGVKGQPTSHISPRALEVPSIQDRISPPVGQEALIGAKPDAIFSDTDIRFTSQSQGTRNEWSQRGVPTFIPQGGCADKSKPDKTLKGFTEDLRTIGAIFDRRREANELADRIDRQVHQVIDRPQVAPVDVFIYDSGENPPTTFNGRLIGELISATGGRDVFSDLSGGLNKVSWEQVATRDPAAILVIDYTNGATGDGDRKVEFLKSAPALKNTRAIKAGHILVVKVAGLGPSLTMLDELESINRFLAKVRK